MVQAPGTERISKRLHHMRLTHHFREIAWAVFAGKHEIGHGVDSNAMHYGYFLSGGLYVWFPALTIKSDGPSRMVMRPTGSDGEPSSPNRGASAGVKARHLNLPAQRSGIGCSPPLH